MSSVSFDPNNVQFPAGWLVGGEIQKGRGEGFEVRRPSDGGLVREERGASSEQIDEAVAAARHAFATSGWATRPPRDRQRVFRKWADLVDQNMEEIAQLESTVSVRLITSTRTRDVPMAAELIRFYGEYIDKIEGTVLATDAGQHSWLINEPYGVVAAISPWNAPLLLATLKIAPALAAGNSVVLKPSELTPYSIIRLAELAYEAGLPPGQLSVLPGLGAGTGSALVRHPDVSYISFTGSTVTGQRIMCDAAMHGLKPVTLELGGKSPQIVYADADLTKAASYIANSFSSHAGQVCFAGTRLIVQAGAADELIERVTRAMSKLRPGPTWREESTFGPIANHSQANRLEQLLAESIRAGAKVLSGGKRIETGSDGIFFEPTLLGQLANENPAVTQEFFGPVLTIQTFDTEEEALTLAEHPVYGLASGVYTSDITKAMRAARAVQAGTVWINHYGPVADINAPMGGYKQSGFGKDFGVAGLMKYLKIKNVSVRF